MTRRSPLPLPHSPSSKVSRPWLGGTGPSELEWSSAQIRRQALRETQSLTEAYSAQQGARACFFLGGLPGAAASCRRTKATSRPQPSSLCAPPCPRPGPQCTRLAGCLPLGPPPPRDWSRGVGGRPRSQRSAVTKADRTDVLSAKPLPQAPQSGASNKPSSNPRI